jgi:hypothetical protein
MFCPQCGARQSDELKYCKTCGVNLHAVRRAVLTRESGEKHAHGNEWVGDVALYEAESKRLAAEFERASGIAPELKRYNEIKSGVITSCVGLGIAIFLFVICQGIILSGQNPPGDAEILSRAWVLGIIPFFVGLGLIINGLFVSKHLVEVARRERQLRPPTAEPATTEPLALRPGDTSEFVPTDFSVVEETTRHLKTPARKGETE